MKLRLFDELPAALQDAINPLLPNKVILQSKPLQNMMSEVYYGRFGILDPGWSGYDIKLRTAWKGYQCIRYFVRQQEKSRYSEPLKESILLLKKEDGLYDIIAINHENTIPLNKTFSAHCPSLDIQTGVEAMMMLDKSYWDDLAIYKSNSHVANYYSIQNPAIAQAVFNKIDDEKTTRAITILDLGCGIGEIYNQFTKLLPPLCGPSLNWLGVDLSQKSIETAKNAFNTQSLPVTWVAANALDFMQNPKHYLDKTAYEKYQSSDLYVIASGILSTGVLLLEDSIRIMQLLGTLPQLKFIAMTNYQQAQISSYMAKQMGFQREELRVTVPSNSLYGYCKSSDDALKQRLLLKAKKSKTLDLSFMLDLAVLQNLQSEDLQEIKYVILGGVRLNSEAMTLLDKWAAFNPALLFIGAGLNKEDNSQWYTSICSSPYRWRFICVDVIDRAQAYSHRFFDNLDKSEEKELPLQLGCHYKKILVKRLFIALNNDTSVLTDDLIAAKNDIHKMLNGLSIYTEKKYNSEQFLTVMQKAGISGTLFDALKNYVYMLPIKCFTEQDYWDDGYYMYYTCGDRSVNAYNVAENLRKQGLFIDNNEWKIIEQRFTDPKYQRYVK